MKNIKFMKNTKFMKKRKKHEQMQVSLSENGAKNKNVCQQCKKVRLSVFGANKMNVCQFSFVIFIWEK